MKVSFCARARKQKPGSERYPYQFVSFSIVAVLLKFMLTPPLPNNSCGASKSNGAVTVTVVHCCVVTLPFMVTLAQGLVETTGGEAGLMPALFSQSVATCC